MPDGTKMQLRLPQSVKVWLRDEAVRNDRSMNNQVVAVLREKMKECSLVPQSQQEGAAVGMHEVTG